VAKLSTVLLLGLMVLAISGGMACVCTRIGCWDSASITVRRPGGTLPPLAVTLDVDGERIECPAPAEGGLVTSPSCGSRTEVDIRRFADSGEQVIEIRNATPKRVTVILRDGAAVLAERTFQPRYEEFSPNGRACGPTCGQWSETWTLP
jgi:hypothetical protein